MTATGMKLSGESLILTHPVYGIKRKITFDYTVK